MIRWTRPVGPMSRPVSADYDALLDEAAKVIDAAQSIASEPGHTIQDINGWMARSTILLDRIKARPAMAVSKLPDPCPTGCLNIEPPYCHCTSCAQTGIPLNEVGMCSSCHELAVHG